MANEASMMDPPGPAVPEEPNSPRRSPLLLRRKLWAISGGSLLAIVIVLLVGITWFYSSEIQSGAFEIDRDPDEFDLRVLAIDGSSITLVQAEGDPDLDAPGRVGVRGESGYGHVTRIIREDAHAVVRRYEPLDGPLRVGDRVRYERDAFPENPLRAFGLSYSEVQISSPPGPMPAWFLPGSTGRSSTWAILVHGRTANREETLRALRVANEAGLTVLSISYRNDDGVAEDPSGEYQFGITEWEDLEAAVEFALANGAEDVVLFGFSMGGGVVAHFMIESDLADEAAGLVLDAPMLNLTSALDLAADQRGVPQPIPWLAANLSRVRFGTDWDRLDTRDEVQELNVPILLFHGTEDDTVPVSQSDRFAEDAGDNVTYVRVEGAEHVGSWNIDPAAYDAAVTKWLSEVVGF